MKKLLTTLVLAMMIIIAGCTDLDEVYRRLENQKKELAAFKAQLKSLEQLTNSINSEITSIKGLVDALNTKVSVVSYKELADKSGYELTLSDGSKITLKHGAKGDKGDPGKEGDPGKKGDDGIVPEINVKLHDDGLLYWTVNNNWLLDANGNKVPAQGKNGEDGEQGAPGADGLTPLLRINADFYWEMSLDKGRTWQAIKDADGNPISAQGPKGEPGQDGDANLTITETDDAIIITYKGITYTLPKGEAPVMMILTTAKSVGETIELFIDAAEADRPDVWIDLNNNGEKDDGEAVTKFRYEVYTLGAQTVTVYGKVTRLLCDDNRLTSLDVSNNTALTILDCRNNHLTTLDVSNNTKLTRLDCPDNQLASLEVGNNTALKYLYCFANQLTSLNVSNSTVLEVLFCAANQLTSLNVSNNKELEKLYCHGNQLTTLDVSNNTKLTRLDCEDNQLISLNVSNNTALTQLSCYNNQLTSLDVSNSTALEKLYCENNQLTELDVSNNKELWRLFCYENKISGANMTALVNSLPDRTGKEEGEFRVFNKSSDTEQNVITSAQAAVATGRNWPVRDSYGSPYTPPGDTPSGDPKMVLTTAKSVGSTIWLRIDAAETDRHDVWIDLNDNGKKDSGEQVTSFRSYVDYKITSKTVTVYGKVTIIGCNGNELIALDVSTNTELRILECSSNQLAELDLLKNTDLTQLNCSGNQLTELDVSANTELFTLWCSNNKISGANMMALVNSLPDRTGKEEGEFRVFNKSSDTEQNVITAAQAAIATGKKWQVLDSTGNPYTPGS